MEQPEIEIHRAPMRILPSWRHPIRRIRMRRILSRPRSPIEIEISRKLEDQLINGDGSARP
jgi:hypothetical protein